MLDNGACLLLALDVVEFGALEAIEERLLIDEVLDIGLASKPLDELD